MDVLWNDPAIMIMFQSYVKLTNARNVQLPVSYNGMGNSEAEIEIEKAVNSTVHLSFQVRRKWACLTKPFRDYCILESPERPR